MRSDRIAAVKANPRAEVGNELERAPYHHIRIGAADCSRGVPLVCRRARHEELDVHNSPASGVVAASVELLVGMLSASCSAKHHGRFTSKVNNHVFVCER